MGRTSIYKCDTCGYEVQISEGIGGLFPVVYKQTIQDAKEGKSGIVLESDAVAELPIGAMGLSTRAYNCLFFAGCRFVSDVVRLRGEQILQMRNLGKVTAAEIAGALENLGIRGTDWDLYLR